jgi:hypothetical protein
VKAATWKVRPTNPNCPQLADCACDTRRTCHTQPIWLSLQRHCSVLIRAAAVFWLPSTAQPFVIWRTLARLRGFRNW